LLGPTPSTSPATSWHFGILAQLAISLGQQMREGRPRVGVGRVQTRGIGGTGGGGGSAVGLMAWFPCRDFIQVLGRCSACAGRAAAALAMARPSHATPELGSNQLAPLPLPCPWDGSGCHSECDASGSRWGEGLAGRAETRRAHAQQANRQGGPPALPECQSGSREL